MKYSLFGRLINEFKWVENSPIISNFTAKYKIVHIGCQSMGLILEPFSLDILCVPFFGSKMIYR